MDDSLKFILNQLNENITTLREEIHSQTSDIRNELKTEIRQIQIRLNTEIMLKKDCGNIRKQNKYKYNSDIKKEELSVRKITVICGTVSAGITLVINFFEAILK